ncbi:MAG: glutamate--tRNA ligase [Myxococcota bacterium]
MAVVTRYAPSPTGALHIGGARTALFNWAFARHEGGRFLLRFEDTDRERSTESSERAVLEALEWIAIDHDPVPGFDGIPRQSERFERYREAVAVLLDAGHAYRCTCTPERVEAMREKARAEGRKPGYDRTCRDKGIGPEPGAPFCVRLAVPEEGGRTRWTDLIAGPSGEDVSQLDDFILARTNGSAIYHLAVVLDDHEMEVTHVIRGRDHLSSTPRQLLLYQALGFEPPEFAHVPLLVEPGGKKLSKRMQAASVQSYRDRGFTPEAVLNYLARLGWGHGDREILSRDELVELFSLEGVGLSPSQVHDDKLIWLNQHYLKTLPADPLLRYLAPFLADAGERPEADQGFRALVELLRERSKTLEEMAQLARFYWVDRVCYEAKAARKFLVPANAAALDDLHRALAELDNWGVDALRQAFEKIQAARGVKLGALAQPVRVAVTGGTASPGIFETLELLGRQRSLARIGTALAHIATAAG